MDMYAKCIGSATKFDGIKETKKKDLTESTHNVGEFGETRIYGNGIYSNERYACPICKGSVDLYYAKRSQEWRFVTHYRKIKDVVSPVPVVVNSDVRYRES